MNGKRIIAVLMMAICLLGILPLSVSAKTELIYFQGVATYTNLHRYSMSSGGWISDKNFGSFTIPIPINLNSTLRVENMSFKEVTQVYIVDEDFNWLASPTPTRNIDYYVFQYSQLSNYLGCFLIIATEPNIGLDPQFYLYDRMVDIVDGSWTLAETSKYIEVVLPDGVEEIPSLSLSFWQRIIYELSPIVTSFYNEFTYPIAFILGVPCCIWLFSFLFKKLYLR